MTFPESNTVGKMILDAAVKLGGKPASMVREEAPPYEDTLLGDALLLTRWAIRASVAGSPEPVTQ